MKRKKCFERINVVEKGRVNTAQSEWKEMVIILFDCFQGINFELCSDSSTAISNTMPNRGLEHHRFFPKHRLQSLL